MPRMSNKRRFEWSFFLNHRNRITYNDLCPWYYSKRRKPQEDTAHGR